MPKPYKQTLQPKLVKEPNPFSLKVDLLHKFQQLKAGLMGDLLSGRKRVNAGTIVNEDIANISNNVII